MITKVKPMYSMLVATELTTEDVLEIFIELSRKLTKERDDALAWKSTFDMYMKAWERETQLYGFLEQHKHHIDSFVITQRELVKDAKQWRAQRESLLNRDPFWNVPEPVEQTPVSKEEA